MDTNNDEKIKRSSSGMDMLHGKLGGKILLFAIPLALTGILQQLFNAADVAVVGQFVGTNAMAAVGSDSVVVSLMLNLFTGVSIGATVVISSAIGRGDSRAIRRGVHTAVVFSVIGGILMAVIGELAAGPLLQLMKVPADIMSMALVYLRIYMAGMPVIVLYNFESAIFRSMGDTRTPLVILVISGVINVILNLFFVLVMGMDTDGVALATVLSNLISSAIMFIILLRRDGDIAIRWRELSIDKRLMKNMLKIGVPAGVQGMVFSVSNMLVQSAINSLGPDIMAASSAAFNIEILVFFLVSSFGQACTTFTSQNRAAGQLERCKSILKICLLQNLAASLIGSAVLLPLGPALLGLFNPAESVAVYGMIRLVYIISLEFINGGMEVFSGCLRGHGHSIGPAVITLCGVCGTRVIWVYTVFKAVPTFGTLMLVYPISWIITCSVLAIYYMAHRREFYGALVRDGAAE